MASDWELVERFAREREEAAFSELARRHVDFVYGAARRMLGGPGSEAEDVTQAVFLLLAQNAGKMRRSGALEGWLFQATRYCCANVRKMARRRRKHEREAAMPEAIMQETREDLSAVLDEGLAMLGEKERSAILVKFLGKKTAREAGAVLGISDAAVEKRVERGIGKLRDFFGKRGHVVPAGGAAMLLAAESAKAAPAGLVQSVALSAGATGRAAMIAKGAAAMMRWAKVKSAAMAGAVVLLIAGSALAVFMEGHGKEAVAIAAPTEATQPAATANAADVDVAALVHDVRAKEKWIENVESFHAVATTVFTESPQGIEQEIADLKKQFPNRTPTVKEEPGLSGRVEGTVELAFDRNRVMVKDHRDNDWDQLKIWDGQNSFTHNIYYGHPSESFSIGKTTEPITTWLGFSLMPADWYGGKFSWLTIDPKVAKQRRTADGDFHLVGREMFEGMDCYVLRAKGPNLEEWHVGVKDHLLYKFGQGQLPGDPLELQLIEAEAAKRGAVVTDDASAEARFKRLPRAERKAISAAEEPLLEAHTKPVMEDWYLDYAEVAPGCWYPKRQVSLVYGYHILKDGTVNADEFEHPWVKYQSEASATDVKVGEKLPDEMFTIQFKEGVNVWDQTQEVPVSYKYHADMTAEEMAKIVENAKRQAAKDDKVKAFQDAMVGQAAPAFGDGAWLNGESVTWEKLKGKVVVLEFFSEWCGPCQNEYPLAVQMDEDREKNGVMVIGIHTAGSKRAKIEKLLEEFGMKYPVYVDEPAEKDEGWGKLFVAYHVDTIPQAVLVDQEGKVAGHGSLGEMARKGRQILDGKNK